MSCGREGEGEGVRCKLNCKSQMKKLGIFGIFRFTQLRFVGININTLFDIYVTQGHDIRGGDEKLTAIPPPPSSSLVEVSHQGSQSTPTSYI